MNFMKKKYCLFIGLVLLAFSFLFSSGAIAATCSSGWVSLLGSYYNGTNATPVTGTPTGTRADTNINFDWGVLSSGVAGMGIDNWAVRWDGTIRPQVSGNYKFQTTTDDGVKLYVNGVLVINDWTGHSATVRTSANVALVAGQLYTVKMEYFDASLSASALLKWQQPGETEYTLIPSVPASPDTSPVCTCSNALLGGAVGAYFNNSILSGSPTNSRLDSTLDFSWGLGAPGVTGIGADYFSVRWDGSFRPSATGNYYFQTTVDDGVRLYVNNLAATVINSWVGNSGATYTAGPIALNANIDYPIRLEYYEALISATIKLQWKLESSGVYRSMGSCPVPTVAYYGISLSSPGTTCAGSPITISAYDSLGVLVAPSAGTVVTLSTLPATGSWANGNTYTFTGSEKTFIKFLRQTTPATLNINLTDGSHSESSSSAMDPNITFASSGLTFYGNSSLAAMHNQVAGTPDPAPVLMAGNCASQVSGAKSVKFAYECLNPTSCIAGQVLTVNGTSAQSNNSGATISYSAAQSLSFSSAGTASIPINYSDAGKVKIHASMTLPESGNDPEITLTGTSADIVFKPYTIAPIAIQTAGAVANPGGTSAAGAAAGFVAAGNTFTVRVEARNSQGYVTPNFGRETPTESNIKFVAQNLVYPSSGGTLTPLSNTSSFAATSSAGTFVNSTISWNQAGSFNASAELADNDYLLAGDLPFKTISGTIGRFYPDHFALISSSTLNSCAAGGFSFLGQPAIGLHYVLQAQSSTNIVLSNYGINYGTPVPGLASLGYVAENLDSGDGAVLTPRLVAGATSTWTNGVMTFNSTSASVLRKLLSFEPDGPFNSLQWGLTLSESFDGGRSLVGKNMDPLHAGPCVGAGCTAVAIGSPLMLRYGRLRLDSASGPETAILPVSFLSEYWRGSYFALNPNDSCTVVPSSAITYPSGTLDVAAHLRVPLSIGETIGSYSNFDSTGVHFTAGTAGHYFTQPDSLGMGSFTVGVNLSTLSWLRYDWNQDQNYSDTTIPNASYSFGRYRGHARILYWREKLN